MSLTHHAPFAYRDDPAVPEFPDRAPVFFIDGDCTLCSHWARIVARRDRTGTARLCPVQSQTGRAVLIHFGLDPDDPESWIYLADGTASTGMEGIARACRFLGGWLRPIGWLVMLPPEGLRNWLYLRIARNRYRVLGRTDLCALSDPAITARLIR
ncbi:MAG: DUF393 domain-containing protein [Pseudomonadota bacterium]